MTHHEESQESDSPSPEYIEKLDPPTASLNIPFTTKEPQQERPADPPCSADTLQRRAEQLEQYDTKRPESMLCFACNRFERRGKLDKWTVGDRKFKCRSRHSYVKYSACVDQHFTNIFYHLGEKGCVKYKWPTFYEVMRGFRLGTDFGTPYLLNTSMRKRSVDSHAISVDDRLLIRRRVVNGFKLDSPISRFSFDYCFSTASVCPHMREQFSDEELLKEIRDAINLWKDYKTRDGTPYLHGYTYKTVRCTSCPTELVIEYIPISLFVGELHKRHRKYPMIFCLTRYVDMGHVLAPEEIEWRSLTTWFDPPGAVQLGLPRSPFERKIVPRDQWPCIDLTHMEPISSRFERHLNMRPGWGPYYDAPLRTQSEHPV